MTPPSVRCYRRCGRSTAPPPLLLEEGGAPGHYPRYHAIAAMGCTGVNAARRQARCGAAWRLGPPWCLTADRHSADNPWSKGCPGEGAEISLAKGTNGAR